MELIESIVSKGVSPVDVAKLFLYSLPALLVLVLPMGVLLAALIVLSRMSADSEVTALRAGGIGFMRLVTPLVIVGIVASAFSLFINEKLVPLANRRRLELQRTIMMKKPVPKIIERDFFQVSNERVLYVDRQNSDGSLEGVMMLEFARDSWPHMVRAKSGYWDGRAWHFGDGVIHEIDENGRAHMDILFAQMEREVETTYGSVSSGDKGPREMSFNELRNKIAELRASALDTRSYEYELCQKTSLPFASLIFILIGAPLATKPARSGVSIGMGMSILIIFMYYVLMSLGRALALSGFIGPMTAAWLQNIIIGGIGAWMLIRADS